MMETLNSDRASYQFDSSNQPQVLFASHTFDGGVFKVGSHHLAKQLSTNGYRVAHVSTPVSPLHLVRKPLDPARLAIARAGAHRDEFGVLQLVPRVAFPSQLHPAPQTMRRILRGIGFDQPDYVFIDQPLLSGLLPLRTNSTVIYRPTDIYTSGVLAKRQIEVLRRAHGVIATSAAVLESLEVPRGTRTLVLENGVDFEHFSTRSHHQRSGIIYAGSLDHRFDWDAVILLANEFPDVTITIAGPTRADFPPLPENVSCVGSLQYEELPTRLAQASVGILPLSGAIENAGRSPMKYYEYLAAGLHVVASSTETLRSRMAAGVELYSTPAELIDMTKRALAQQQENILGAADAAGQDWSRKASALMAFAHDVRRRQLGLVKASEDLTR
ncbi:glycosyltransferase [Leifsonia sp. A12D58]|uniref:glycosyltransferase n=1 Tax=Leifsonia sp. A12D58 TaxID=3397674 RepID=UPI0039DFBAED